MRRETSLPRVGTRGDHGPRFAGNQRSSGNPRLADIMRTGDSCERSSDRRLQDILWAA